MRIIVDGERIRHFFGDVKDDPGFEHSRKLFESGQLPLEMVQVLLIRPDMLKTFTGFSSSVYPGGRIERVLKEKVIIRASQLNDCQFCVDSHCDFIRDFDIPPGHELTAITERERLRWNIVRSLHLPPTLFLMTCSRAFRGTSLMRKLLS